MNIILSGFMGSGKTTVAKTLSKMLNMDFIDIDDVIEQRACMKVAEIFNNNGEKAFRKFESEAVEIISQKDNCVIATGGGTLLDSQNEKALRKNGKIVFLDVSVDTVIRRLENDTTRPLLNKSDKENAVSELLLGRMPIYRAASDFFVDANNDDPEITAGKIIKKL